VVVDGDRVAARYRLIATMRKGNVIATEIYLFGLLADDGRLRRATQITRMIPAPGDQSQGDQTPKDQTITA
jgi:hypothetical protein